MTVTKFNSVPIKLSFVSNNNMACYEYFDFTYTAYHCEDEFLSYIVKLD